MDIWQIDYDPIAQRWQQTYNITRPAGQPHTVDFNSASPRKEDENETSTSEK